MSPRTVGPARVVGETTLTGLAVPLRQSGVLLGRDQAGQPVLAPVFGSRPVSITFVGGWWAAQVLVHRCLGHGATVVVDALDTTMPAQDAAMAGLAHWLTLDRTTAPAPAARPRRPAGSGRWPATRRWRGRPRPSSRCCGCTTSVRPVRPVGRRCSRGTPSSPPWPGSPRRACRW